MVKKKASAWVLVHTEGAVTVTSRPFVFRQLPEMKKIIDEYVDRPEAPAASRLCVVYQHLGAVT